MPLQRPDRCCVPSKYTPCNLVAQIPAGWWSPKKSPPPPAPIEIPAPAPRPRISSPVMSPVEIGTFAQGNSNNATNTPLHLAIPDIRNKSWSVIDPHQVSKKIQRATTGFNSQSAPIIRPQDAPMTASEAAAWGRRVRRARQFRLTTSTSRRLHPPIWPSSFRKANKRLTKRRGEDVFRLEGTVTPSSRAKIRTAEGANFRAYPKLRYLVGEGSAQRASESSEEEGEVPSDIQSVAGPALPQVTVGPGPVVEQAQQKPATSQPSVMKRLMKATSMANISQRLPSRSKAKTGAGDREAHHGLRTPKFRLAPRDGGNGKQLALARVDDAWEFFDQAARELRISEERSFPLQQWSPSVPRITVSPLQDSVDNRSESENTEPGSPTVSVARQRWMRQSRRSVDPIVANENQLLSPPLVSKDVNAPLTPPKRRSKQVAPPSVTSWSSQNVPLPWHDNSMFFERDDRVPIEVLLGRESEFTNLQVRPQTMAHPALAHSHCPQTSTPSRGATSGGPRAAVYQSPQNHRSLTASEIPSGASSRYSSNNESTPGLPRSPGMWNLAAHYRPVVSGRIPSDPFSPETTRAQGIQHHVFRELRGYLAEEEEEEEGH